jgi:hypothetical protein
MGVVSRSRTVRLFIQDDEDGSLATVAISNWTGNILVIPRPCPREWQQRVDLRRPGVYVLVGDPEKSVRPQIYIGESECVGDRLRRHEKDSARDIWQLACIVTSCDGNLTKAHIRYMEGRLIAMARQAETACVLNAASPEPARLPEADIADMEYFIEQLRFTLGLLGFDYFGKQRRLVFNT